MIIGSTYLLVGMAILAMCFDLMQEEIVAKFRWIGRKMGLVDKENSQQNSNNADKGTNQTDPNQSNHQRPASSDLARGNSNSSMSNRDRAIDDDNEAGWPNYRGVTSGRKLSPRNHNARVHPMIGDSSNEGTLHQRAPSFKQK